MVMRACLFWRVWFFVVLGACAVAARADVGVSSLRVEGQVRPLGVETEQPRFSWVISSDRNDVVQKWYRIIVASSPENLAGGKGDLWDSGKVQSDSSVLVTYKGKPLPYNSRMWWKVRVGTNKGDSEWSEAAEFGTGMRGESHWRGNWIGWDEPFDWDDESMHSRLSARYLREEFDNGGKTVRRAMVHISGLGLYEMFINGEKVGDDVLTPSPTDYRRTVLYNTYDVTPLLRQEKNAIGIVLGNGRYYNMRQNHKPWKIVNFGYPKVRMNLFIEYTDGTKARIVTNDKWRLTGRGPIRSNNEYDGEEYDARLDLGDWTKPGYDDSAWLKARRAELPYGTLRAATNPSMKVMRTIKPRKIRRTGPKGFIVDFGENTAGWVRLNVRDCVSGDSITVRYSERINGDSTELDTENLRTALSTDLYIASGNENGESWSPRFSYHGFQFVRVEGLDEIGDEDVTAEVIYDNVPENGTFECSNPIINAIYANAKRGIASLYKGMPVDCPQRDERQPWTGDHNMGSWGENFIYDNAALYAKWADDIRESQREDGCLPDIAPAFYNYYNPDMTWSSTFPVVCDMLYEQTGDVKPIKRNYEAMARWMRFIRREYTDRDGLIMADKYGDWCVPPESPGLIHSQDPARKTDPKLIATAYFYKMSQLMAKFAPLAGHPDEAETWLADGEKAKDAFNRKFLTVRPGTSPAAKEHFLYPDSTYYGNNSSTSNILPLAFGMVPEECRKAVEGNLLHSLIVDKKGSNYTAHVASGVVGVNWMMRLLTAIGRGDVAAGLISHTEYPGFGYEVSKGATTIWELWNGDKAARAMNSLNHVMMLGDLVNWLYQDLGGINPAKPGYKEILLKPDFSVDDIDSCSVSYNTPYGLLGSKWNKTLSRIDWEIEVPCNTSATFVVPAPKNDVKVSGARFLRYEDGKSYWHAPSGKYDIEVTTRPSSDPMRACVVTDEFLFTEAPFTECHAATIAPNENGDLVAAFFGGTKERNPDCVIWTCRKPKNQDSWTAPEIAADGVFALSDPNASRVGLSGIDSTTTVAGAGLIKDAASFGDLSVARRKACWNPVLFSVPGSGEMTLYYKVGSSVGDWTGWKVTSRDGGITWGDRQPLPDGILGPIKNKPEYIDGRIVSPSSREGKGWRAWIELSDDGGKTWRSTGALASDSAYLTADKSRMRPIFAIQPGILRLSDGRLQILCRTRNAHLATSYSSDNGETWTPVSLTDLPANNSGTDCVTLKDGRHLLVYNDFETIDGTPKGVRTPLCVALSDDDGKTWRNIATLEDSPLGQFSYPAIIQTPDGLVHVIYTHRRHRIRHQVLDPSLMK